MDPTDRNNPCPKGTGKKVLIVIEEENGGHGFNVYMDGDIQRLKNDIHPDEMTAAEFWGTRLFRIVVDAVRKSGAVQNITDRSKPQ